jgi:hypothetical protein
MKKIFFLLTSTVLLAGCAETIALLGPASSVVGGGNIVHSTLSSAASYGVKKTTGKSPMQHALAYAKEHNPDKKKDNCISFVKQVKSEACYIAKKQIIDAKQAAVQKIKKVVASSKINIAEKIKTKQNSFLAVETKKELQITEGKLKSVESILTESVMSKKQISHLRVSIDKNLKIKDSSK